MCGKPAFVLVAVLLFLNGKEGTCTQPQHVGSQAQIPVSQEGPIKQHRYYSEGAGCEVKGYEGTGAREPQASIQDYQGKISLGDTRKYSRYTTSKAQDSDYYYGEGEKKQKEQISTIQPIRKRFTYVPASQEESETTNQSENVSETNSQNTSTTEAYEQESSQSQGYKLNTVATPENSEDSAQYLTENVIQSEKNKTYQDYEPSKESLIDQQPDSELQSYQQSNSNTEKCQQSYPQSEEKTTKESVIDEQLPSEFQRYQQSNLHTEKYQQISRQPEEQTTKQSVSIQRPASEFQRYPHSNSQAKNYQQSAPQYEEQTTKESVSDQQPASEFQSYQPNSQTENYQQSATQSEEQTNKVSVSDQQSPSELQKYQQPASESQNYQQPPSETQDYQQLASRTPDYRQPSATTQKYQKESTQQEVIEPQTSETDIYKKSEPQSNTYDEQSLTTSETYKESTTPSYIQDQTPTKSQSGPVEQPTTAEYEEVKVQRRIPPQYKNQEGYSGKEEPGYTRLADQLETSSSTKKKDSAQESSNYWTESPKGLYRSRSLERIEPTTEGNLVQQGVGNTKSGR